MPAWHILDWDHTAMLHKRSKAEGHLAQDRGLLYLAFAFAAAVTLAVSLPPPSHLLF